MATVLVETQPANLNPGPSQIGWQRFWMKGSQLVRIGPAWSTVRSSPWRLYDDRDGRR